MRRLFSASPLGRPAASPDDGKLGTFIGVFTPTVLTILGVIMYLRFGWITGHMGIPRTLLIVIIANSITLVTTLSFSAIATNSRVGVGGAYYIISRSLGLESGGAIGLPLFLSQVFSVTLYAFGLAESVRFFWAEAPVQPIAIAIILGVGLLAFRGAGGALKAQVPIMALIGVSLVALALGAFTGTRVPGSGEGIRESPGFWTVFAVFFPAVTGIMAGLGLSGDLRNPMRAIPRGALAAVGVGFVVYLTVPLVLQAGATREALVEDPLVWTRIAPLGVLLILPGLWGAIFSSAVGSILGAPRTLQALAADGLAPKMFSKVSPKLGEPVAGLVVSLLIALAAASLGNLNAVAPVVTMFFLTVYGMINVVAALENLSGDPTWRPALRVPWLLCLAAGVACFWVMFLINPLAALAAVVIELLLWNTLSRRERKARWGDVRRGVYESLIRWSLVQLAHRPMNPRNWRPHVLVFAESVEQRLELIRFGTWFSQGRGVVTVCELVVGDLLTEERSVIEREAEIQESLRREGLVAFGEVDVVPDVISGITSVAQANGMAGLDSNTMLLGMPKSPERLTEFLQVIRRLERIKKSVVIAKIHPGTTQYRRTTPRIHIWWGGMRRNGDLMLLLGHLLTRNPEWRHSRIRILSVASNEYMKTATEKYLADLIPKIRIEAESTVMLRPAGKSVRDLIQETSGDADVVFLGLEVPKDEKDLPRAVERTLDLTRGLKTVFLVKNASLFVGKLMTPPGEEPQDDIVPGAKPTALSDDPVRRDAEPREPS